MGGAGQQTPSSQSPSADGKRERINTLTAVSAFQIHSGESPADDSFVVDGRPLGQVMLVGVVRSVEMAETKITMTIEDHTGAMEVAKWRDADTEDDDGAAADTCREGMYVRVVGQVKKFNDKMSVTAFSLTPVLDSNQITAHLLEILYSHLRFTKGALDAQGNPVGAVGVPVYGGGGGGGGGGTFNPGNGGAAVGGDQYNRADVAATAGGIGGTPVQNAVLDVIKSAMDDAGINVDSISAQLQGQFQNHDIKDAIEWLSTEGHVYSTIDEDHFKSTDS